jgi:hypothetical protein
MTAIPNQTVTQTIIQTTTIAAITQTVTLPVQTTTPPQVTNLTVQSPLLNERFVKGETVTFNASIKSDASVDGSQLLWTSNKDGNLGNGPEMKISKLSPGTHNIDVIGYGQKASLTIRIFNDLWELYQAGPAQGEIDRILNDFTFNWVDGSVDDEKWASYDPWVFDQKSINPAKIVAVAKLDILRHQRFSEPLPFPNSTAGETAYEHIRKYVKSIELRLDAGYNSAGGGKISFNRGFCTWYGLWSGTKTAATELGLYNYVNALYLLFHEARHCEPGDPGHVTLSRGMAGDPTFENGGGYAQAALYCMWIYQYGFYDTLESKQEARLLAVLSVTDGSTAGSSRFPDKPTHSNPKIQSILDQFLNYPYPAELATGLTTGLKGIIEANYNYGFTTDNAGLVTYSYAWTIKNLSADKKIAGYTFRCSIYFKGGLFLDSSSTTRNTTITPGGMIEDSVNIICNKATSDRITAKGGIIVGITMENIVYS